MVTDFFDVLPDDLVLSIFKKLQDAESLCVSMSVCKRFQSIAPQVDHIFLPIPHKKAKALAADQELDKISFFKKALMKPFHFISRMINPESSKNDCQVLNFYSYYVRTEILKRFQRLRELHLRLPWIGYQTKKRNKAFPVLLNWKAEFGRELHSCVILAAKSCRSRKPGGEEENVPESGQMTNEELKLRIIWMMWCLIAGSARHYLVQETVKAQEMIENVVVSDEINQGRLWMNRQQLEEMRQVKRDGDQVLAFRSRVPRLRMRMWYLKRLEVADSGKVMEGVTLMVIRSVAAECSGSDGEMVAEAFREEKVFAEAARKCYSLPKTRYTWEKNSCVLDPVLYPNNPVNVNVPDQVYR